jgi:hypothetical protein
MWCVCANRRRRSPTPLPVATGVAHADARLFVFHRLSPQLCSSADFFATGRDRPTGGPGGDEFDAAAATVSGHSPCGPARPDDARPNSVDHQHPYLASCVSVVFLVGMIIGVIFVNGCYITKSDC